MRITAPRRIIAAVSAGVAAALSALLLYGSTAPDAGHSLSSQSLTLQVSKISGHSLR